MEVRFNLLVVATIAREAIGNQLAANTGWQSSSNTSTLRASLARSEQLPAHEKTVTCKIADNGLECYRAPPLEGVSQPHEVSREALGNHIKKWGVAAFAVGR